MNELKSNVDIGVSNIEKLGSIVNIDPYVLNYPQVTDVIRNEKLRELGLTYPVLHSYEYICKVRIMFHDPSKVITNLNTVILDNDILNSFKNIEDKNKRKTAYFNILQRCAKLIELTDDFDKYYKMISSLARNKRIRNPEKINDLLLWLQENGFVLDRKNNLGLLESILFEPGAWDSIHEIVRILIYVDQETENDANLAFLTKNIYDKLQKEEANKFYSTLLFTIDFLLIKIKGNLSMKDINDFIIALLDNKYFIEYSKRNELKFIKCALSTGKEYLDYYSKLATDSLQYTSQELNEKILNSFDPELEIDQLQTKVVVYSKPEVLSTINDDPNVLRKLNFIINNERFISTDGEFELLQNPEFLKSDFFQNYYTNLVGSHKLRSIDIEIKNKIFHILSTFDFNDPNLVFYVNNLLAIDNLGELDKIYNERINDKENGYLSDIGTSLYEVLASKDEERIDEYINMLAQTPNKFDIKADTKMIYHKQIGKRKN